MPRYRVELAEPAERDIAEAEEWIAADSAAAAERWIDGLLAALQSLESMPARCPLAPEDEDHPEEIRQLIYQRYRVLFTILGRRVVVLMSVTVHVCRFIRSENYPTLALLGWGTHVSR